MRSNIGVGRGLSLGPLLLLMIGSASGQTQNPPPPLIRPSSPALHIQIQRTMDQKRLAKLEADDRARSNALRRRERVWRLEESDRKRIEELLTPDPADVAANKELLDQKRTGIFRLFPNADCATKQQIRVDGDCANHVPGGSSYSFRSGAHTPDINFNGGQLVGDGFFSQVIVTALGDLPLTNLSEAASKIDFLNSFVPAKDFTGARQQRAEILKGIRDNGVTYSNTVVPKLNLTYAMRIVAYRNGNNLIRRLPRDGVSSDNPLTTFQRIQDEDRYDLVVAFRVIRREADGNLTILWKEVNRKKSPVITFERDDPLIDFK